MKHISSRTKQHEVWLIIMRLLSVLMSRTKSSSKSGSEVTKIYHLCLKISACKRNFLIKCGSHKGLHWSALLWTVIGPVKTYVVSVTRVFCWGKIRRSHVHLFLSNFFDLWELYYRNEKIFIYSQEIHVTSVCSCWVQCLFNSYAKKCNIFKLVNIWEREWIELQDLSAVKKFIRISANLFWNQV